MASVPFTARVFPIEAGGLKHVEIGYSEVLPERHGVSRLVLPLVSEAARRPRSAVTAFARGAPGRARILHRGS